MTETPASPASTAEPLPRHGAARALRGFDYVLLSLPFVGLLYPDWYARWTPEIFGVPFFYAYQFAWILLTTALLLWVYRRVEG